MAKQSPLAQWQRANGAAFVEHEGWLLADHFGDPKNEYQCVRTACGLFDLSQRALLQFTGPDRVSFLQGMLSNDLRRLSMFEGQQATLLTQQGKVLADVRVLCAMNSIYLDFWEPLKDKIYSHLNRYLVADEVEINQPSDSWTILSLQGTRAPELLDTLFNRAELPKLPDHHRMVQFNGAPICIVRADHGGGKGFDLIVGKAQVLATAEELARLGASWIGVRAQNILRVEAGIPRYGVDFTEQNLLLEVGLDNAVSFTKGCYLGQEVVERIRSRGHVNRKLCGLLLDGDEPANAGDKILAQERSVGEITSSVVSLALNRPIAMGYIHKDHCAPDTCLEVRHESSVYSATVVSMPFVAPSPAHS